MTRTLPLFLIFLVLAAALYCFLLGSEEEDFGTKRENRAVAPAGEAAPRGEDIAAKLEEPAPLLGEEDAVTEEPSPEGEVVNKAGAEEAEAKENEGPLLT